MQLTTNEIIEIVAVALSLVYLYFLIKENILCWVFGILASSVSIYLFYQTGLYAESLLYTYYVLIGFYGYYVWNKANSATNPSAPEAELKISTLSFIQHIKWLSVGTIFGFLLGFLLTEYTDSTSPYLEAFTASFSFVASFLEVKKYINAWTFWMVINLLTLIVYMTKDLHVYSGLQVVYFVFSIVGYIQWRKKLIV